MFAISKRLTHVVVYFPNDSFLHIRNGQMARALLYHSS